MKKNFTVAVKEKGLDLFLDIPDNLIIYSDKQRINQILINVIGNAIKYTPPNGRIIIKTEIKNNSIILSVRDNGIGFTADEKKIIFKQFGKIERYGQGWDVGIEGTGLGLYISKELIALHEGRIWVESEGRDKGSTFFFSIPKEWGRKILNLVIKMKYTKNWTPNFLLFHNHILSLEDFWW